MRTRFPWVMVGVCAACVSCGSGTGGNGAPVDAAGVNPPGVPDATPVVDVVDPPFTGQLGTIMFVTQVPVAAFATVTSAFGNQLADMEAVPRGGDLMIRYPDGTLRNLTREAGYGMTGMQGANAIAVRDPSVHWSGDKALFAMVIGAPARQFEVDTFQWQLYEVTGLGEGETATITKVANQPAYNNTAPFYGTDDRVLFTSERPRGGESYLYPQLDEYESQKTNVGIYSLDPVSGDLRLLDHSPSGDFSPSIDSAGRVVFIRWDHLQRDQQADEDRQNPTYGSFTYADESEDAAKITSLDGQEVFPEPRDMNDPDYNAAISLHTFNQFFPWQINEDGTAMETLNHVGRHELGGTYSDGSFTSDPNLTYLTPDADHANRYYISGDGGLLQLREDPTTPGTFYATWAPEFYTASTGQLLKLTGGVTLNAEQMVLTPITVSLQSPDGQDPMLDRYRDPLPMSNGTLIASHTLSTSSIANYGTTDAPTINADLRLVTIDANGNPSAPIMSGVTVDLSWWRPDDLVSYHGALWELQPVEVMPRTRPARRAETMDTPESGVFSDVGVDPAKLQQWLTDRDLALIVSRNVTARDRADQHQPFNLQVASSAGVGGASTMGKPGTMYDISWLQIFQADQLRGYSKDGRRVLARPMHGPDLLASPSGAPAGSVAVAADGSIAALVPARRALTWQLTATDGSGVVLERNWVTFQPGEIRTCPACHGVNTMDQAGRPSPENAPEALRLFLTTWKQQNP